MKLVQHDAYVHVSAIDQLPAAFRAPARRAVAACESWAPDVLQVMLKAEDPAETLIVKLACCDDFDGNPEPAILTHIKVRVSKGMPVEVLSERKGGDNPLIYHGKEMLVNPDYKGFDLEQAAARRAAYLKKKPDTLRMGRQRWWKEWFNQ